LVFGFQFSVGRPGWLRDCGDRRRRVVVGGMLAFVLLASGCRRDMQDQPKFKPLRPSTFFADGRSARPLPDGSVSRSQLRDDALFYTGKIEGGQQAGPGGAAPGATGPAGPQSGGAQPGVNAGGSGATAGLRPGETTVSGQTPQPQSYAGYANVFPFPITKEALDRGQERFRIYCSVCHGESGDGLGMIVRRGYRQPPSYHVDRLRQAPVGYFFDVVTNGFGAMPDYAAQIAPDDRWKIIAYIRALQLSQGASIADVPESERGKLNSGAAPQGEHQQ